jgi:hypothetical protein
VLDRYFGNVCELDIIFNFHKAYYILDEMFIGGHLQEVFMYIYIYMHIYVFIYTYLFIYVFRHIYIYIYIYICIYIYMYTSINIRHLYITVYMYMNTLFDSIINICVQTSSVAVMCIYTIWHG